jgi:hypothetical protein
MTDRLRVRRILHSPLSGKLRVFDHLERWTVRNRDHAKTLESEFDTNKLFHDLDASRAITRWAYTIAEQSQSKVWLSRTSRFVDLDTGGARFPTFDAALRGSGSVLGTETNWFGKPSLADAPSSGILVLWPTRGSP